MYKVHALLNNLVCVIGSRTVCMRSLFFPITNGDERSHMALHNRMTQV